MTGSAAVGIENEENTILLLRSLADTLIHVLSTASLIVGIAAAAKQNYVLIADAAGLVAGAMSMAAGEYVSVSSQSDTEKADIALERWELNEDPQAEHEELDELGISEITTARPVQAAPTSCRNIFHGCGHAIADGRGLPAVLHKLRKVLEEKWGIEFVQEVQSSKTVVVLRKALEKPFRATALPPFGPARNRDGAVDCSLPENL